MELITVQYMVIITTTTTTITTTSITISRTRKTEEGEDLSAAGWMIN